MDPANEESFWRSLRDRGGARFVRSLDWIGLDAYPGTVFPPVESGIDGYRDGMVNGISTLRCFARTPGIPESVPMKVEENGWPTFPGRSRAMQAAVLEAMVNAVHDFRGTYNITDYRWFNLRDGDTSSPQPFQHFGLFDSGYVEKPAFAVYRRLVDRLARDEAAPSPRRPRVGLRVRGRNRFDTRGRSCFDGLIRARIIGTERGLVRHARFRLASRRFKLDRRAPFSRVVHRPGRRGAHRHVARAAVRLRDGRLVRLRRAFRACR